MSLLIVIFGLLLSPLSLVRLSNACGMGLHSEITYRAMYQFRQTAAHEPTALRYIDYMDQYPTYVQAGAFFPDWGFGCADLGYGDISEDAHWPNFTRVAAEYIRETYPQPYTPHAQRLLAFFYSILSHNVADIQWHSLGYDDGFIRVMADIEFQRLYNPAHGDADNGGEFLLRHMSPPPYETDTWSVPLQDMREIYKRYGHRLDPVLMKHCVWRGFLAKQVIKKLSQYNWFYSQFAKVAPFLIEQIETFHRGGMHDMAAHTTLCWQNITLFFQNSFDLRANHLCEAYNGTIRDDPPNHRGDLPFPLPPTKNRTQDEEDQVREQVMAEMGYGVKVQQEEAGIVSFSVENREQKDEGKKRVSMLMKREYTGWDTEKERNAKTDRQRVKRDEKSNGCKPVTEAGINSVVYEIPNAYASLGYALVSGDFNNDTFPDLAMSAPFYTIASENDLPTRPHSGAVIIVNGAKNKYSDLARGTKIDVMQDADLVLLGERERMGRLGFAMGVVDLNCDGVDDLAISAPTLNHPDSPLVQAGAIYVYFGRSGLGLPSSPDLEISLGANDTVWHRGGGNLTGLGTVLRGADVDGDGCPDLLVGWPWATLEDYTNGSWSKLMWEVRHQQTGSVLAFLSSSRHRGHVSPLDADWILNSPANIAYELFGSSIDFSPTHGVLLVGAPGWSTPNKTVSVGRVYGYNVTGSGRGQPPEQIFGVSGTQSYQQFGREIKSLDGIGEEGIVAVGATTETRYLLPDFSSLLTYFPTLFFSTNSFGYASYMSPWTTETRWQIGTVRMLSVPNMLARLSKAQRSLSSPLAMDFLLSDTDVWSGPEAPIRVTVEGGESGARLGSVGWATSRKVQTGVHMGEKREEQEGGSLWFSEPFADEESGRLYSTISQSILSTTNLGKNINIRNGTQCLSFQPGAKARLGHQILLTDINGDSKPDLVVTALHADGSNGDRLSGNIIIVLQ